MKGAPTDFWGKLTRSAETDVVSHWHPLIDHCADVAACAAALLELPTWRRRLANVYRADDLDASTRARLSVLAALHDVGKFNLGFQAKGRKELGGSAGHVREALGAINTTFLSAIDPLGDWGDGTTGLLVSSICHHGRPYAFNGPQPFQRAWWDNKGGLDPQKGVAQLVTACRDWFPLAFTDGASALEERPEFEHAFAGLVMLADWIGSDTRLFPFSEAAEVDRMSFSRREGSKFFREAWLDVSDTRRADGAEHAGFRRVSPHLVPKPAQMVMASLPCDDVASITILESETGSGKTEAALARFVTLFSAGKVDGLYFALPTRTAASEMHARVLAAVQRAFGEPPPVVLAVPGYLRVDDVEGERNNLARFDVLWPDADRFRYRGWAGEGPKRYLAGCIVVGTIDQVLLSSLRVKHAHMRAASLMRMLLVVDEVHASDAYMTRVLEDVLARHQRAGGHAMLLSATLGGEARARLLRPLQPWDLPPMDAAIDTPYPLISHRPAGSGTTLTPCESTSRDVTIEIRPTLEDRAAVAAAALAAARAGAKVLVVKNTVADCIETQRDLERLASPDDSMTILFACNGIIAPHHARFARSDREALDAALAQRFGQQQAAGGCVLIATQTVQQSLDLDADLLLTDLCPADVLLQRIGRLHRHSRTRPPGFELPRALVLVPANRDLGVLLGEQGKARHHHGLGSVYSDLRILEATWSLLEESSAWSIPSMNRSIVERSLHSSALRAITSALGERWVTHEQLLLGSERGETRHADLNLIDWLTPYSDTNFADDVRIPTRLGEDDRRVHFAMAFTSPFGQAVSELTVRASWASGIAPDVHEATAVKCGRGATRFLFGNHEFIYDRHGLRRAEDTIDDGGDDGP